MTTALLPPRAESLLVQIDRLWGQCPVQAFGHIGDLPFYFHSRFDKWTFAIADNPTIDPVWVAIGEAPGFRLQHYYGAPGRNEASFMSLSQARALIISSATYYLNSEQKVKALIGEEK